MLAGAGVGGSDNSVVVVSSDLAVVLGSGDGMEVNETVGADVGVLVGVGEGSCDGWIVGRDVGAAVGN